MKFRTIPRGLLLGFAIVTTPLAMAQSYGVVTVGRAGQENCTTDSLEDALEHAKTSRYDDIIWISKDVGPNFLPDGTIEIKDQNVEIIGGFDDCNGFAGPSGYQVLSGAVGNQTESVIRIRGESNVRLSHLEITGGDEDDPSDEGGGIDFKGSGSLTLTHVRLNNNKAGYGGGMFVSGGTEANPLYLVLGDDVAITDNQAYRNGGGIYVGGNVDLAMSGVEVALHRNEARGVRSNNATLDGYGGGLYMKRPARAKVTGRGFNRPGPTLYPIFLMNTARYGGAIAATGVLDYSLRDSHLLMKDSVLEWNRALVEGGGIYFGAYFGDGPLAYPFCGRGVEFNENAAPRGAAIFASADGAQAGVQMRGRCGVDPEFACYETSTCGRFVGNRTESGNGDLTQGAVIEFPGQNGQIALDKVMFSHNIAGTAVFMGDNGSSKLELTNCLFVDNALSRHVVDTDASDSRISQCTIAGNSLSGSHVLRMVESDADDGHVALTKNIIYQPDVSVLDHIGPWSQSEVRYLMVHDTAGLPMDVTVFAGDPRFDHSKVPYGLSTGSPAVDYAPIDNLQRDRVGHIRTVDQPLDANEYGPRDLGAYELEIYGARIFFGGFEQ